MATPDFTQATLLPPAASFPTAAPGCISGNDCTHATPGISDVDLVSWILACEAGSAAGNPAPGSIQDAIANAHMVYNRMDSGTYRGTAVEVVSQGEGESGQFQPYFEGCDSSLGLANLSAIDPDIRDAAQELVNGTEPTEAAFNPYIDWLGLYSFGVYNPNGTGTPPPVETMLAPYCPDIPKAMRVFIDIASFGGGSRINASVFFSDFPGCSL